ncbi:MAG: V-type ATP synthase subunit F [Bacillota bacterium]
MLYKAAVIGEYDSILGFTSLGLEIWPVADALQAADKLQELAGDPRYAVIFITESAAGDNLPLIEKYSTNTMPAVIMIPGVGGETGTAMERLRKIVEKAVGADILFGKEGRA